jgi:hypothetical protein
MNEITYEQALKYFQSHDLYWAAFIDGIVAKREGYISDMKRNMETPNCNDSARFEVNGAIVAMDDLVYDFKLPARDSSDVEPE